VKLTCQTEIDIITDTLTGTRKTKFLESIGIIQSALNRGGWAKGESRRANSGFTNGCGLNLHGIPASAIISHQLYSCVNFGSKIDPKNIERAVEIFNDLVLTKREERIYTPNFIRAWIVLEFRLTRNIAAEKFR
jgi:hypothetical protein